MKNTKKRGFTIVELVIVIAVIAVLAAVLIPTFVGLTERANKSVDEQLCTNYNKLLQTEVPFNNDITLGEFVTVLEENGINSNHFNTHSKTYAFAFYAKGEDRKCVLVNKESGEVLYPKDIVEKTPAPSDLWAVVDDAQLFMKGIENYTLLKTANYKAESVSRKETPKVIDLNGNLMVFGAMPTNALSLVNGTAVYQTTKANITTNETVTEIKSDDANAKVAAKPSEISTAMKENWTGVTATSAQMTGKSFYHTTEHAEGKSSVGVNLKDCIPSTVTNDENTTIIIENCTFYNLPLHVTATLDKCNIEIRNCTFTNIEGYSIQIGSAKSYSIHDNLFDNTNRGMNLCIPTTKAEIYNNTFELDSIATANKGEHKDNAIQFRYDGLEKCLNPNGTLVDNNFEIKIYNNTITKAQALVTIHAGFACSKDADYTTRIVGFKENVLPKITFENNTLGNAKKVIADPGMEEDLDKNIANNSVPSGQKASRTEHYNAIVAAFEGKVK